MNRSPNNPTAPKVALLGPLPPPYGGYASYVILLRGSLLAERFGYAIIDHEPHPPRSDAHAWAASRNPQSV